MTTWLVFFILIAYLLGSVSSAIVVTKLFVNTDIRQQGSGNPGATNVLRVAGKKAAAVVFLFDVLKGALPVYLGFLFGLEPLGLSAIAISACIGHIFPVYFEFKGGKGVATALGALLPLNWWLALCLVTTWGLVFALSRISSLAAIFTFLLAPIYTYLFEPDYTIAVSLLCLLILARHKQNIFRLFAKQEHKLRRKKK
jgi:glycerol-3-phosphate acyltransferase PlsY